MRKTFLKVSILAAIGVAMSASFTSCKDYDDDINNLQTQVDALKQSISTLEGKINAGAVITGVSTIDNGYRFTLSDGKTYDITNGKDGANGKDGESNLWTIVKDAEGKLVWALNGVATEYPAQGPAGENGKPGENGESLPGIYYKPGENGYWIEVNPADGTEKETTIAWKPAATESLYAVVDNDKVVIYNFTDENGDAIDPVTIWKSSFIKSLVVKPELYLDGIESVKYAVAKDVTVKKTVAANNSTVPNANNKGKDATVANGQPFDVTALQANGKDVLWYAGEIGTIQYAVNPTTAAISNVDWNLIFDDIEVINRSSNAAGKVLKASDVDKNGNVTLTYQLDADAAYAYLAPYELGNVDKTGDWTFMALQALNKTDNNSVVTSDNVAVIKKWVNIQTLLVDQNTNFKTAIPVAENATEAIQAVYIPTPTQTPVLAIPYNAAYNLAAHIAVSVAEQTPMLAENTQDYDDAKWGAAQVMTLAEAAEKWGLTPAYQLVTYTVSPNQTSEDRFAQINATTGEVTPMYVNSNGQSVSGVGAEGNVARSSIGRRPLVYVTLNNADGEIILAGFVTLEISEPLPPSNETVLADANIPYICNYEVKSTWEQITGKVYEELGLTPEEFSKNYTLTDANAVYVKDADDNFVNTTVAGVEYGQLGTWTWDNNADGSHTQALTFEVTVDNLNAWYPTYDKDGNINGTAAPTTESATKTVYAKLVNKNTNHEVYIGFNITVLGSPAADFVTKLASSWQGNTAPVNPAVAGQTTTPIEGNTDYGYAQVMGMDFRYLWVGGEPQVVNANALYNFTKPAAPHFLSKITANYNFAANQPKVTGATGTVYTIVRGYQANGFSDTQSLWAIPAGSKTNEAMNYQPVAVITATDAKETEIGGDATIGITDKKQSNGVWNRFDMLSVFNQDVYTGDHYVRTPFFDGTITEAYAEYACDIVNASIFKYQNAPVQFNVEMVVSYAEMDEDGNALCTLTIPESYDFQAGVGSPLAMAKQEATKLQDAKDAKVIVSKLFSISDWQGNKLWNVNATTGATTATTFNGATVGDFWMSLSNYPTIWPTQRYNYADKTWETINDVTAFITIDAANALVGYSADVTATIGKFSEVFDGMNPKPSFDLYNNNVAVTNNVAKVNDWRNLGNYSLQWDNNGMAVTKSIFLFVPVKFTYIWGRDINLGYAVIEVKPTYQGEN